MSPCERVDQSLNADNGWMSASVKSDSAAMAGAPIRNSRTAADTHHRKGSSGKLAGSRGLDARQQGFKRRTWPTHGG
jgi:hypothetical protein